MKLSSLKYSFRDALRSLWRNKAMTIASITTVALSLLILGYAWLLVINTDYLAASMESELEISVSLDLELSREQTEAMKTVFMNNPKVAELEFITKEEGLQQLQKSFGEDTNLSLALGGENPLPDVYIIKASEAELVPVLAQELIQMEGVEKVRYGQGMVEKLLSLTRWLRGVGVIVVIAVALAALFLITTTIRLTVFARRHEISIMKLVGATDWYIRWPFFLEGMLIGLVGGTIAVFLLGFCYHELIAHISTAVSFLPINTNQDTLFAIYRNILIFGTALGALGSAISLRRFLKV